MRCFSCHKEIAPKKRITRFWKEIRYTLCSDERCLRRNLEAIINEHKNKK